jgi:hypothetical protein
MKIAERAKRAGVAASAEETLADFRHTENEVWARVRPFVEVALGAADRPLRPALA